MKNHLKTIAFAAILGIAGVGLVGADQWDKKTVITTDEAMQLPTMMLQPGTYVLKLADSASNRHIVQFFDKDEKHLVTTILAIPNQRLRVTGKSVFAFWEVPAGQPKTLRAWFYPGDNFGQEFAYPREAASRISASNNGATVPISDADDTAKGTAAAVAQPTPSAPVPTAAAEPAPVPAPRAETTAPEPVAEPAAPPAPPAEVAAAPAPAPQAPIVSQDPRPVRAVDPNSDAQRLNQTPEPSSLPKTASNLPLVVLTGLLSISGALALKLVYRRG